MMPLLQGHGESAALPLPLLQIAAVTVRLPLYDFCRCRMIVTLPLRHIFNPAALSPPTRIFLA
jgi:hypothetical protein